MSDLCHVFAFDLRSGEDEDGEGSDTDSSDEDEDAEELTPDLEIKILQVAHLH
jgi:hypothetical protein